MPTSLHEDLETTISYFVILLHVSAHDGHLHWSKHAQEVL
jgi:hypothetical protein